jgi:hypothetical protein
MVNPLPAQLSSFASRPVRCTCACAVTGISSSFPLAEYCGRLRSTDSYVNKKSVISTLPFTAIEP